MSASQKVFFVGYVSGLVVAIAMSIAATVVH